MDCYSIYQLLTIKPSGCVRQYILKWQSWIVWAYRTCLHASNHLVLAKSKFDTLKHVPSYVPPLQDQLLYIMTSSFGTFIPWSFNSCQEYLYPTCAACPSISWLKIVTISQIVFGLVLFLCVNPNLRNLFSEFSMGFLGCGMLPKILLL